jgi:repressor LexA
MSDIINRVLELMGKKDITPYRICKDNKIPHSSFSQILKGEAQFKLEQVINLAKYFNIDIKYLIYGEGESLNVIFDKPNYNIKTNAIPIVGTVGCGQSLKSWEQYGDKFLDLPDTGHLNNPFILIAKGDSMRPYINPNDKLLCADQPELIKNGRAVITCFKTEPETADANAKLIKYLKNDMVMLYSINTKYDPAIYYKDDIQYIYKLIRIIRDVR